MISKKVTRYYSDCGKGFWRKQQALTHDENCKCWKNPRFQTCLTCKHKKFANDSNGMEDEPQFLETWITNMCERVDSFVPAHKNANHIAIRCNMWELK